MDSKSEVDGVLASILEEKELVTTIVQDAALETQSLDGSSVGMTPSISSSVSSLSTNALARQIEMRERVAGAFAALDIIRSSIPSEGDTQETSNMPTCTYWPPEFNSLARPRPWLDARDEFPLILERRFQYNFENGKVTASFETPPDARIKVNVFRSGQVTPERVYWGKDLQYEANTRKGENKEVDPEDIRTLCNDVYAELKRTAHEEIAEKMTHSAGEAVWEAQRLLLINPPPGFVCWDDLQGRQLNYCRDAAAAVAEPKQEQEEEVGKEKHVGEQKQQLNLTGLELELKSSLTTSSEQEKEQEQEKAFDTRTETPEIMIHCSPEASSAYPYNFGVRMRRRTGRGSDSVIHFYCLASDKCRRRNFVVQFECNPPEPPPVKSLYKGTNLQKPPRAPQSLRKIVEAHLQDDHWGQLLQTGWAPAIQKTGMLGERERSDEYMALPVKEFRVLGAQDKDKDKGEGEDEGEKETKADSK